jgi:flagellar hook-length control protein FliK
VAEASQTVLEESAAGTPFDAALSRAPKAPPAPPAVPVETAADRPAPKPHAGPDLFSARVPRTVPTPAPTPEPKAPPVLATPESVPVEPAPPAPSAQVPVRALPMAVVEGAPESVPPVRSEGGRASSAADVRRSEMFSSAARSAQSAAPAPDTDRVEFVERLMKAARITMLKGQSRLKMTLNPPHLGSLRVDLAVRDHVLNGTLRTETAAARDMILSHLQSLKDQLEGQGIHVGSFDVNVDQAFAQARQQDPDAAPARERASAPAAAKSEAPASVAADRIRSAQFQLIDVMA